jgi:cell division septum initiation protein DivIVA
MSIRADVQELENIKAEIRVLNEKKKKLREREKAVEGKISEYLKAKDTPGVKFQGTAIILEQKETRGSKKPKQRDAEAVSILEKYGIKSPEKVLTELMEARKGEKMVASKIKMKKYQQDTI